MMKVLENKWFWIAAFGALFALSIDAWAWGWTEPSFLGLPYTIVYIIILETILFLLFWAFIRFYWKNETEGRE